MEGLDKFPIRLGLSVLSDTELILVLTLWTASTDSKFGIDIFANQMEKNGWNIEQTAIKFPLESVYID